MVETTKETPAQRNQGSSKRLLKNYLDLGSMSAENKMLKSLLYDEVTGLPTLALLLNQISFSLKTHKQVALLYVDIKRSTKIQEAFGYKVFDHTMNVVSRTLEQLRGEKLRKDDIVSAVMKSGSSFIIMLSPPRKQKEITHKDLLAIRKRLLKSLRARVKQVVDQSVYRRFYCRCGTAIIENKPGFTVEHLVFDAVETARENAETREIEHKEKKLDQLSKLIAERKLNTLYQPIVHLSSNKIIGYEAFTRGPRGETPESLFKMAIDADMVWKLDKACRERAFVTAKGLPADYLFLNISAYAIADPELKNIGNSLYLKKSKIKPEQIVFDVSERSMVEDFDLFPTMLNYLKTIGFKVSIDNVGSGYYGGLELLTRTKPDFVKIDNHLVHDIHEDESKQDLAETIIKFGSKAGAHISAAGIEKADELKKLQEIGVQFGQGYLFARPGEPFPELKKKQTRSSKKKTKPKS